MVLITHFFFVPSAPFSYVQSQMLVHYQGSQDHNIVFENLFESHVWFCAHAREGYNSHFVSLSVCQSYTLSVCQSDTLSVCQSDTLSVCLCVTFPFWRRRRFQG